MPLLSFAIVSRRTLFLLLSLIWLSCGRIGYDGQNAEETSWFRDADGDGFGTAADSVLALDAPAGYVADSSDCDDDPGACGDGCFPGNLALDVCDQADQDCDGAVDEDPDLSFYADADGDSFGDPNTAIGACFAPAGFVDDASDCDDDPAACGALCSPARTEFFANANCGDAFDNDCDGPADLDDAGCSAIMPPLVEFTISPGIGDTTTVFVGDASATFDADEPSTNLSYAWDWDGDGTTDDTGITSSFSYGAEGVYTAVLTVVDSQGLQGIRSFLVIVDAPGDIIIVTTAADEADVAATPVVPGGTGLSLREAIAFAAVSPGRQQILVPSGMIIAINTPLDANDSLSWDLVGDGASIDGSALGGGSPCFSLNNGTTRIFGLEIRNCVGAGLSVVAGSGHQFSRLSIRDSQTGVFLGGDGGSLFGPDNTIVASGNFGLHITRPHEVFDNHISDSAQDGIHLDDALSGSVVRGNTIARNFRGIALTATANGAILIHNTIVGNINSGVFIPFNVQGTDLRNNIFSDNALAILARTANFSSLDANDYFDNSAVCSACGTGPSSLALDPLYLDAASDDYRLHPGSPCIDVGADTGSDRNGPAPGNFSGSAPDIGAYESL